MINMLFRSLRWLCTKKPPTVVHSLNPLSKTLTITLSNTPHRNILSSQTENLLQHSLSHAQSLIKNNRIRSIWIKSTGTVFSAGHDLKQLKDSKDPEGLFQRGAEICMGLRKIQVPVVCVVDGLVAGAGNELVVACDIVIATENAKFAIPAINAGLFPTTPAVLLSRLMNHEKKLKGVLMLAEGLSAEEAYRFGMVTKLVKKEELQKEEEELVAKINNLSAEVLALGKKELYKQSSEPDITEAYKMGIEAMCRNLALKDCNQGLKAFKDKRHPQFNK